MRIIETTDGGYIAVGSTQSIDGDISLNHGMEDVYVTKITSSGVIQWQKCYGGTQYDYGSAIIQTSDGGYLISGSTKSSDGDVTFNHSFTSHSDAWLLKISSSGAIQWQKCYGGSNSEYAFDVRQTIDGGYIFIGFCQTNGGDVSGNHGNEDVWIVKTNSLGTLQWQQCYGGTGDDRGQQILTTPDGGYIFAGYTVSFNNDVVGNHGNNDAWIVKLSNSGSIQWQKCYGGLNIDQASSIAITSDGGYVFSGRTNSVEGDVTFNHGGFDCWVVKTNNLGSIQWQKSIGGSNTDGGNNIIQTPSGEILVSLYTSSNNGDISGFHGNMDGSIFKLDIWGGLIWQRTFGSTGPDSIQDIKISNDGSIIATGASGANNGDVSGFHGGYNDLWTIKLFDGCTATITASGSTYLCSDSSVLLSANTGVGLTYQWQSNGSNISGATSQAYSTSTAGSYTVVITDSTGCVAISDPTIVSAISGPQIDAGPDLTICPGEIVTLTIPIDTTNAGEFYSNYGLVFLPDGSGAVYTTSISVTGYDTNTTFQNTCDLELLTLGIEHSYLGDLEISLTCPNGQSVSILNAYNQTPTGWNELIPGGCGNYISTSLGNDTDIDGGPPGNPVWTYAFSGCNHTNGTICAEAMAGTNLISNDYMNSSGAPIQSMDTAGIYNFDGDLNTLIGCPMNGNWTITVQDNQAIDDGYIFGWSLDFGGTTGSTSASVVSWDNGVSNNVPFSPDSTNVYTATAISSAGCVSTDQVVITVLPFSATAQIVPNTNQTVCENDSLVLSTNNSGAIGYQWYLNGQAISGATGNTLAVDTTGAYFVFIDDSSLCYTNSDTVNIQVLSSPILQLEVLGGQDTLCDNGYILVDGADQFLWQDGSQLNYLEVNQAGIYTVTGIDANGCQATDSINVYMNYSTDTILYVSAIDQYTLNGETYYQTAVYTQILTNSVGCDSTILLDLDLGFTGLTEDGEVLFSVYPNPTKDYLYIESNLETDLSFSLYDSRGRKVLEGKLNESEQTIDLRDVLTGLYYLKIGNEVVKVIVER